MNYRFYFAQAYGQGSYSGCTYNTSCTSTSNGDNSGSSAQLTNTGFDIAVFVTLACFLIFIALVVRLWRKKRSQLQIPAEEEIADDSDQENSTEK